MAEMVAHIDTREMKVRFFNTRLEMLIFISGGPITDFDTYDCSDVFIGGCYGDSSQHLSSLREETPTT
jgi:hypothetical protein